MNAKPPVKGDLSKTFSKHASRAFRDALSHTKIWGVPTEIIPFSRIESMAPANLDRAQIWSRSYSQLTEKEQEFYRYHAVRLWEENDYKVKKKRQQPRDLYEKVRSAFDAGPGTLANVVSFVHYGDELTGKRQPDASGHGLANRDFAYVMIDDMHSADFMMESWLQPAAFESLRKKGVNDDAFHYWILQHEFAHITGAGEAQADMMATAAYMKEFKKDDLPRMMADMRAISTMQSLRHYARIEDMLENPKRLRDRWPLRRRKIRKALESVAENLRTYGWNCVEGIDRWVGYGVNTALQMDEKSLFRLRQSTTEARNKLALELVREVHEHSGRTYTPGTSLSETSFARNMRAYLADLAEQDESTLPVSARVKMQIGKRYLTAVDNLIRRDFEPEGGAMPAPKDARAHPYAQRFRKRAATRRLA